MCVEEGAGLAGGGFPEEWQKLYFGGTGLCCWDFLSQPRCRGWHLAMVCRGSAWSGGSGFPGPHAGRSFWVKRERHFFHRGGKVWFGRWEGRRGGQWTKTWCLQMNWRYCDSGYYMDEFFFFLICCDLLTGFSCQHFCIHNMKEKNVGSGVRYRSGRIWFNFCHLW